ncbi:MAG: hypothetical protein RL513_1616, partial [Pseudomonadota bacterium]
LDEGLLPGRAVLGEHLRLGSQAVILSRTFNRPDAGSSYEDGIRALRQAERELAARDPAHIRADAHDTADRIRQIADGMVAAR